jgi:hypothetical protein
MRSVRADRYSERCGQNQMTIVHRLDASMSNQGEGMKIRVGALRGTRAVGAVMGACLMVGGLTACGGSSGEDTQTLNVLTWQGYHEQEWLDEFTEETGIKVNAVNVGSPDEMFAKVKANPQQFDIALVTSGWYDN